MQKSTDERRPSTAFRLEDLQLSAEQIDAVQRGLTIAVTKAHLALLQAR